MVLNTICLIARSSDDAHRPILTPHALPMFKEDFPGMGKRKREKLRADPMKTKKPGMLCLSLYHDQLPFKLMRYSLRQKCLYLVQEREESWEPV